MKIDISGDIGIEEQGKIKQPTFVIRVGCNRLFMRIFETINGFQKNCHLFLRETYNGYGGSVFHA